MNMSLLKPIFANVIKFKTWFLKTSFRNKVIIGMVVVVAGLIARPVVLDSNNKNISYQTEPAQKGTLIVSVTASGSVSSANSEPVTTSISGVVKELYVQNGDSIEAGKPIAKLDLDQTSLNKQTSAYATYLSAVSSEKAAEQGKLSADASMWSSQQSVLDAQNSVNVKNDNTVNPGTKQNYTDLEKQSIDSGLVQAQKAFSANQQKYLQSDSAISSAKAQQSAAWLAYQQTLPTILSPISGIVSDLSLQVGTIIVGSNSSTSGNSSSSSTSSSQQIATIKTEGNPTITINLTEIDAPTVHVGDHATVTFDAFPDKTYTGRVMSINTSGSVSSGVTSYPTTIVLDIAPPNVYPNMSATASIITNTTDDVILVPSSAVQTSNEVSTVRILKNGIPQTVTVETGLSNDTQTEITSGISEGDAVITGQTGGKTPSTRSGNTASPFSGTGGRGGFGGGSGGFGGGNRVFTR